MGKRQNEFNLFRIVDANYNRAKEGIRVCEDIFRFLYNKGDISSEYKKIRHRITELISFFPLDKIMISRDSISDVGRGMNNLETNRDSVKDIFFANSQRVKESIRVLEEFAKLYDLKVAEGFKKLRYDIYDLEQKGWVLLHNR